ncbi:MAG TPA: hypothetical protein V6C72_08765, partial [Chroococcales cyanobacterium]
MSKAREFASSSDAPQGGSEKNYQSLVQEIQSLRRDASGVGKTADVSSDLSALNQHLHDMGVLPSLTIEQHGNNGQSHQHHGCGHHGAEGHSHRSHPGHSGHHDSAVDLMHKQIDRLDKDTQDKDKSRLSHDLQNFNRLLHSLGMPREFQLELVSTSPEPGSGGGSRSTSGSDSGTGSTTQNGKPPSEISNPTEPNNPSNSDNPGDSSGPSQPTPAIEPVDSPPATLSPTPAGLPGDGSLSAAVGGSKSVHLKNGVYTFSNFNGSTHAGDTLPASISFSGSGMNSTVIEMNRDTSTHAREIPTTDGTTTNPFYLLKVEGGSPTLSNFTLAGTDQGHLYNGLRMDHTSNALVKDVKVTHIPGNSRVNPGETFAINDQHGVN